MRIFTLGKMGIPLFLFTLLLFSGTHSSYGQANCPTVADPLQEFCFPSTIADLVATENGDAISWYRTETSTNPIPENELLQDNVYYAGNSTGTCTTRVAVTVTVTELPVPISQTGELWQACLYASGDETLYTVQTLANRMTTTDISYNIQVFATETGGTVLNPAELLTPGNTYFVAQTDPGPGGCSSPRIAINYDTILATTPTGDAVQMFCSADISTPTVADLVASGNNRWYSTATSNPALDPTTPLVDGETYFATMVVNKDDSTLPPCESVGRFAVTVNLTYSLTQETQEFCGSIGTGNSSGAPIVADLTPAGADWFADAALTIPVASTDELIDATPYYYVPDSAACSVTEVTVALRPTPNAGMTSQETFCEDAGVIDLLTYIQPSPALGAPDANGTFNNANFTGTEFDPADLGPGTYVLTYTVPSIGSCPADSSRFTLTILEAPDAGADINETVCSALFDDPLALQAQFVGYLTGRDLTGTFDLNGTPTVETYTAEQAGGLLYAQYLNGATSFSVTYNLADADCPDSAQVNILIIDGPDAGDGGTIQLVKDTTNTTTLEEANAGTAVTGGLWTDADGNTVEGDLAPQQAGIYTYTVSGTECDGTATVTVLAPLLDCPVVTESVQRFCENIGTEMPTVSFLEPASAVWYASADATDALPANTILVDGSVYFAGSADNSCTDRDSVTVDLFDTPNAGMTTQVSFCANEAAVNLVDYITPSQLGPAQQGGRFSPALENNQFDPAAFGPGEYSFDYIVEGNEDCPTDEARITVTVEAAPNAGSNGTIQLQDTANTETLEDALEGTPLPGGAWTDDADNPVAADFVPQQAGSYSYTVTVGECTATATVTVLAPPVDCPVVTESIQRFCENIGTERPTVSFLEPADAVWYASADATDALPANTILVDGSVYFAGSADNSCTDRDSVTVDLFDTPNAGMTTQVSFCANEAAVNLVDFITPSQLGPAQQGGRFSPALENNEFDPAAFGPGEYSFDYIVEGNEDCPTDEARITVTVGAVPNAGVDVSETFCASSPDDLPTREELLAAYADDTRDQTGTFNPTLATLAAAFQTNPYGVFATVYTVTANGCTDSANLSVTINEEVPAEAGEEVTANVCSTEGIVNLEDFLTEDAILGGTFSAPYENGTFDPSTAGTDAIVITYTVNEDIACVTGEDTTTITLTVIAGPDAGEDGSITLNVTDAPVNLFDSLGGTPDADGTWTPGNASGDLDPSSLEAGTYAYVYTVTSDNGCEDTATVTVTIEGEVICPDVTNNAQSFCESILTGNDSRLPNVTDLLPAGATWYASADATEALPANTVLVNGTTYFAGNSNGTCDARESVTVTLDDSPNAGATTQVTFCESDEPIDLLDVLNPSILGDADLGGTFSPALASGTTIFDPAVDAAGSYTYTVESTNDVCPRDNAVIQITLTPSANAGEDSSVEFCATQEAVDLTDYLAEGVDTNGTFADLDGNIFDPAAVEAGSYEFTYTVTTTGTCVTEDSSVVTVVVTEAPAAPTAQDQSFCVIDAATVADLTADGDNLLWYSDASLETLVDEADALVAATYYVTTTTEGGCESAGTAVVVTFNDAAAPTLSVDGNVFCEFDNPTLATLTENVSGGNITWYDAATGGTALTSTQALRNATTYYAASTDATSACESSVRLAVTVTLEECEAVIPDAFSPNNDGINDTFVVDNLREQYPNFTIEIFNRWGNVVYKGNASTQDWDGVSTESRSLGDKVLPVGVYFYIVNFNDGQTPPTQGRLYLSR